MNSAGKTRYQTRITCHVHAELMISAWLMHFQAASTSGYLAWMLHLMHSDKLPPPGVLCVCPCSACVMVHSRGGVLRGKTYSSLLLQNHDLLNMGTAHWTWGREHERLGTAHACMATGPEQNICISLPAHHTLSGFVCHAEWHS